MSTKEDAVANVIMYIVWSMLVGVLLFNTFVNPLPNILINVVKVLLWVNIIVMFVAGAILITMLSRFNLIPENKHSTLDKLTDNFYSVKKLARSLSLSSITLLATLANDMVAYSVMYVVNGLVIFGLRYTIITMWKEYKSNKGCGKTHELRSNCKF